MGNCIVWLPARGLIRQFYLCQISASSVSRNTLRNSVNSTVNCLRCSSLGCSHITKSGCSDTPILSLDRPSDCRIVESVGVSWAGCMLVCMPQGCGLGLETVSSRGVYTMGEWCEMHHGENGGLSDNNDAFAHVCNNLCRDLSRPYGGLNTWTW